MTTEQRIERVARAIQSTSTAMPSPDLAKALADDIEALLAEIEHG